MKYSTIKAKNCSATAMWAPRERVDICKSDSFLISALDEGECSASRPDRALPPGKGPLVPTG
jgi:hypothetical protein